MALSRIVVDSVSEQPVVPGIKGNFRAEFHKPFGGAMKREQQTEH
ncbi:MAG TPA: hypothetical protein VFF39_12455 [Verrucomicrobiae bacterium]|nr:hypothetical protein [Verrucomicrobiae bacterium]